MTERKKFLWEETFPEIANWNAPIRETTIPAIFDAAIAKSGDRPAITFRDTTLTYNDLAGRVDKLAAGLRRLGVKQGDQVALYLPNTPYHPITFFAAMKLGARIVHLSPLDSMRELAHKLQNSGAETLVTTNFGNLLTTAQRLLQEGTVKEILVGDDAVWGKEDTAEPIPEIDGMISLSDLFIDFPDEVWPTITPEDIAVIQYTGGTTGLSKGAILTHGNLTAAVSMFHAITPSADFKAGEERVICVAPLFHIFGLSGIMLSHLAYGNEVVLFTRFDAETIVHEIETNKATIMPGVPTMWIAIANLPDIQSRDLSALKDARSGGAPMPADVQKQLEKMIGRRILGGWGMTETSPAGTRLVPGEPGPAGLIGIPYPGIDMRIVSQDAPGQALGIGEIGEIAIRGPNVFKGYWNNKTATEEAFVDGYFLTGDIGLMDAKGQFSIVDRKKNMIISSGFNVYPASIENAIYDHPDVKEVIVIGVPDTYRGQAAKAFIVLKSGRSEMTIDELRLFLKDKVGKHEMPVALEYRENLPRSPAGKLLARDLIEEEKTKLNSAS